MYKLLFILFCFFTFSIFIVKYNGILYKKYGNKFSCLDIANQELFSIFGIKACLWNLSHIIIYFFLCILINARLSIYRHFIVFTIGILWYISSPYTTKLKSANCKNNDIVYSNTYIPRKDDIFFNTLGQLFYILFYNF